MSVLQDPAWRQHERPDAGPDAGDVEAEIPCERCGRATLLDTMQLTAQGSVVCFECYCQTFTLKPLPEGAP